MFSSTYTVPAAAILIALLSVSLYAAALPTRSSATDTGSRDTSASGDRGESTSGSGDNCDAELSRRQVNKLVSQIEEGINGLYDTLEEVHMWTDEVMHGKFVLTLLLLMLNILYQRATVDVYNTSILPISINSTLISSDYAHAIALSVSYFQMFVRPVGDVLTNETVREVIDRLAGFADKFSTISDNMTVIINGLYKLVSTILL